jgi:hypothetical protein
VLTIKRGRIGEQKGRLFQPALLFAQFLRRSGSSRLHKTKSVEPPISRNIVHLLSLFGAGNATPEENSMTKRFMMSVAAAALMAGTGFANAQGTGKDREQPSAGSTVQQSAPPSERGSSSGMKATQSEEKSPGAAKTQRAEDKDKVQGQKSTQSDQKAPGAAKSQRAEDKDMQGQKSKSMSSESEGAKGGKEIKGGKEMKAEQKGAADSKAQTGQSQTGQPAQTGQSTKSGQSTQSGKSTQTGQTAPQSQTGQTTTQSQTGTSVQSQTTGQAGAAAKLSTEQRTQITTVIRDQHVQPLTNVNFSIVIGTRVPRDVRFHPLPRQVVTIYPEWRGYEFILVNNQILVIDPRTFEIVAILEA